MVRALTSVLEHPSMSIYFEAVCCCYMVRIILPTLHQISSSEHFLPVLNPWVTNCSSLYCVQVPLPIKSQLLLQYPAEVSSFSLNSMVQCASCLISTVQIWWHILRVTNSQAHRFTTCSKVEDLILSMLIMILSCSIPPSDKNSINEHASTGPLQIHDNHHKPLTKEYSISSTSLCLLHAVRFLPSWIRCT